MRQTFLLKNMVERYACTYFGLEESVENAQKAKSLEEAVAYAENLLFPIPMCKGNRLNMQQNPEMSKEELLALIKPGQNIFAGCIDKAWKSAAEEKGAVCYDYMEECTIAIYNSIATAEGTIAEIIRTDPRNLHGTKILVLGYGTCAKTLAAKLKALDARVSVAARKEHALMEAYAHGFHAVCMQRLPDEIGQYPIIINTIPARILTKTELACVDKKSRIYEIASLPYGVDVDAAKELGVTVFICPALPAKYAPASSAEILEQYIVGKLGGNT